MRDEVVGLKDEADGAVAIAVPVTVGKVTGGLAVYHKVAGAVLVKTADDVQKGGLAAAGVTEDRNKLALPKFQVNALERMDDLVADGLVLVNAFEP